MEYRSPLGSNFKLERSLLASDEAKNQETPKRNDIISTDSYSDSRKSFNFSDRRKSKGRNSYGDKSPSWQRHSNNWKSPNFRNSVEESVPISHFYHPSMLEDPWEELEKNSK